MIEHSLKTHSVYWDAIKRREKTFEVRRDDRCFQKGDVLLLRRMNPETGSYYREGGDPTLFTEHDYEAQTLRMEITFVLAGGQFGIEPGYVVLGLKDARGMAE